MATRNKGTVFRVTGLSALQTDNELKAALKAAIDDNLAEDEQSKPSPNIGIVPSCYDKDEKVALVEFHGGVPAFLSELMANPLGDWQVEMGDDTDISFDQHFFGFTQLYTPKLDSPATADIIAITGLDGHAYGSWRGKGNLGRMWLRDFLSKDLPCCRTMVYGYNSKLSTHGVDTIMDYGRRLIEELKKVRNTEELRKRPLFFIAHSFGGIILAHCLVKAVQTDEDDHPTIASLHRATYGMLLFGIPHKGLVIDDIQKMVAGEGNLPRSVLLEQIRSKSDLLAFQLVDFRNLIRDRKVVSFLEMGQTRQLEFDGESKRWRRTGDFVTAVDAESGLLHLPDSIEDKIPLDADHSMMVKFTNRNSQGYTSALDKLKQFERDAPSVVAARFLRGENRPKPSSMVPFQRDIAFVGRDDILVEIEIMTRIQQIALPKIRGQDNSTVNLINQENWYQNTEECKKWKREDTCEFLWFRGRSGTGKTLEIKEILRFFDTFKSDLVDTVAYFCPRMSLRSETVLRSMVIQLGRCQSRVSLLDPTQKSDLLSLIESEISTSAEVLWSLFHSLLQTSDRKVCIILDGIDALPLEDLRGFATSLHRIWSTARFESATRSAKNTWFKILVTSRPNVELFEIFRNEMIIDPDTERSECLYSLALGAENPRQNDKNISRPVRATGEWIITDPRYRAWAVSDCSDILWLFGKPGSGKSTLLLKLLKESLRPTSVPSLQRMLNDITDNEAPMHNEQHRNQSINPDLDVERDSLVERRVVVSYFYNFRNKNEVDDRRMLQSILFQILTQEPRLFPLFRIRYLQLRRLGSKTSVSWTYDDLINIFHTIINFKGFRLRIELFLDAVDESKHSSRVMDTLHQQLARHTRSDVIFKAIVTRRPMETFHEFPSDRKIHLEAHNAVDIDKLINEGIENIERTLKNFSDRVDFVQQRLLEFQNKLRGRADGVVLWVSIALTTVLNNSVRGDFTINSMMKTLDALPSDLEELYAHIVSRLRKQGEEDVQNVKHRLHWTTHSGRTLTVNEFFHAIALSEILRATHNRPLHLEDVVIPHAYLEGVRTTLSSSCGGFLEVQAPQHGSVLYDSEIFLVQLIHRSVRTFLEKEEAGPFRAVRQECNLKITQACIHYLKISLGCHGTIPDVVAFVDHLGRHSLLTYIWNELPTHLLELAPEDLLVNLQDLTSHLQVLCEIDPSHSGLLMLHTWILQLLTQIPSEQQEIEQWKFNTRSKLTELASSKTAFQHFFRNALVAAVETKHFLALRIICGAGALLCDEKDQVLSAVLEIAAKTNSLRVLELIGEHRISIDPASSTALSDTLGKALETACSNGYTGVTTWLLERRAVSGTGDQGYTAIHQAVNAGHDSVVKLLLDHGISPDSNRKDARTLLWIAAEMGHENVVQILLQFGLDPNIADDQHRTPLFAALMAGHEPVVKLLLPVTTEDRDIAISTSMLSSRTSKFLVPRERNTNFVGRADILHLLEEALKSQVTRIALVGLGGIGKTQTVTEFTYRIFEDQIASTILWIDASSDDSFLRDHEYISRRVQWQLAPKDPPESQLTQFYYHLSFEPGTKVVIWDNVDYASDLIEFANSLPSTQRLCIIITSRDAIFSQKFAKDTGYIRLSNLSTSESITLLGGTANNTLRAVAEQLGGLPLAIIQAASYMRGHHISPLEYKLLLDEALDRSQEGYSNFTYNAALSHTIAISLDRLETKDALAFKILSFVSVLDADHIPKYLLTHLLADFVPQISMEDLDRSIASLRNFSLVHLTLDQSCLDLHRFVQDAIRRRLYQKGDIALWENAALRTISREFPQSGYEEWEKCGELLSHALVVLECNVAKDEENYFHRYKLLQRAGTYVMETGRYALSEKLLQEAYIVSMKQYGLDSTESQSVATLLAQLFLLMGRLDEAKNLEEQVLRLRGMTLGLEHPDTLASMGNLASAYRNQGRWKEAEEMQVQVMEASKRVLGHEHPDSLTGMANLAFTYQMQGQWKEAEQLDLQVLETRKRVLGQEHPHTLTSVDNLALVLRYQGKYEQAKEMNQQALEGREKALGKEHPDTLTSVDNLGSVLQSQGKYEEAEAMQRRALEGREKVLGVEHPDTLTSVSQLGSVLSRQGKYEEAEAMQRRALEGREKVLGVEHPDTLTSVSQLGSVLERQGKYEEAEAMHQRDLQGSEKVLGVEHPHTLTSVRNLGWVLQRQGKYEEAEAMHRRALEGSEKVLGVEHPDTLTSVNNLGSVLERQGKYEEAEAMHRRDLEGREKVLGVEHPDTLTSMANLASTLWGQGELKEAGDMEMRVMETRQRVLGHEHPDTLMAMGNLAVTLKSQCRNEEAISLMNTCVQLHERVFGCHHPDTESFLETLNKWQMENRGIRV